MDEQPKIRIALGETLIESYRLNDRLLYRVTVAGKPLAVRKWTLAFDIKGLPELLLDYLPDQG